MIQLKLCPRCKEVMVPEKKKSNKFMDLVYLYRPKCKISALVNKENGL